MKSSVQVRPWALYLLAHPNRLLLRFRNASDASAHCQVLRQLQPNHRYQVVYDLSDKRPVTGCSSLD
jgi:hypothetical protein